MGSGSAQLLREGPRIFKLLGARSDRGNFTMVIHSRSEVVIAANHFLGESKATSSRSFDCCFSRV